ncbi:hypothetical protein [Bifidobacterium crudilactis]|uniref:hypothetical protein n=1 Tax=Bifidobacterium crudilactis TaxID=327277 RepID=UPI00054D8D78|nr:hypothetical protein [Bifidobacterium crudilactis]
MHKQLEKSSPENLETVMITNFDSTIQRQQWDQTIQTLISKQMTESTRADTMTDMPISDLWGHENPTPCKIITNRFPALRESFTGRLRTAFLYCDKILLTHSSILDGVFFLAFGPEMIREELGLAKADQPVLIISGTGRNLLDCLIQFTTTTIQSVRDHYPQECGIPISSCAGKPTQKTLQVKRYSAMGIDITPGDALGLESSCYDKLTEMLEDPTDTDNVVDGIISALEQSKQAPANGLAAVSEQWKRWIRAEQTGDIIYVRQAQLPKAKDAQTALESNTRQTFANRFEQLATRYKETLVSVIQSRSFPLPADTDIADVCNTLNTIAKEPKRSNAFASIHKFQSKHEAGYPDTPENDQESSVSHLLIDWYQFVYQKTMASHLDSFLLAVNAPRNSFQYILSEKDRKDIMTLSGSVTNLLAKMPNAQFSRLCYTCQKTVREWRACGHETPQSVRRVRTRNMSYAVNQITKQHNMSSDAKRLGVSLLVSAILAVVSSVCDNILPSDGNNWLLVIIIACLIQIAPNILDGLAWLWGVHSNDKTVIYLDAA